MVVSEVPKNLIESYLTSLDTWWWTAIQWHTVRLYHKTFDEWIHTTTADYVYICCTSQSVSTRLHQY